MDMRKKQANAGGLSRLLLRPAGPYGWQAPASRRTSSTARRRTSTASHHALRGRPPCPLRSENGTVRKKQAHTGGLSRLLLRPAGPCGWQAPPSRRTDFLDGSTTDIDCFTSRATRPTAPCGPPPDTWPRLVVGGRRAGSPPASSSPSTALCGPSPGTWPRLGVGHSRGAARGELAGFIFTIDCTLRASDRHLASAGCRGEARRSEERRVGKECSS